MAVEALPDTRAELAVPLQIGNVVTGVLDIQSDQPDAFEPDDVLALQTLANQIAISIRNAQLYEGEQRRRRLAESLEQAGRELSSSLDVTEVLGHILDQLATVVPYERCGVVLEQGATMKFAAHRGFPDDERVKDLRIIIREGDVYQQMIETHSHILVDDVTQEAGWKQVEWLPLNQSWLGIPLIAKDRVVAMISMTRREAGAFSAEDALLASTFAGQAAIALENAKLYSELNQAYQNLERLDKTKSDFINVTAHELRTPLTVIKGYTQVLQVLPVGQDAQSKPLLDGILTGMARMHEVVNSILDVTKIDAQALTLSKDLVVLGNTLQRVQAELQDALQERALTLNVEGLNRLPLIQADPALLYKVFYQLVINAIKYTPDGGAITVSGQAVEDESWGKGVEIVVQDTGIGIDPAHHELIFEKFYQTGEVAVHSSGRTKFKGGWRSSRVSSRRTGDGSGLKANATTRNAAPAAVFTCACRLKDRPLESRKPSGSGSNVWPRFTTLRCQFQNHSSSGPAIQPRISASPLTWIEVTWPPSPAWTWAPIPAPTSTRLATLYGVAPAWIASRWTC
jgi:K+-sensing histidine kinase KdpD